MPCAGLQGRWESRQYAYTEAKSSYTFLKMHQGWQCSLSMHGAWCSPQHLINPRWWHGSIIPAFGKQRQEGQDQGHCQLCVGFEASLGYIKTPLERQGASSPCLWGGKTMSLTNKTVKYKLAFLLLKQLGLGQLGYLKGRSTLHLLK